MTISLKSYRYFRSLAIAAMLAGTALIAFTCITMKWVGFSRVLGMYLGVFFLPIAALELCAFLSERYWPETRMSTPTVVTSIVWTLLMIFPIVLIITESPLRYGMVLTSEELWRRFPDTYAEILGGSLIIVCVWLVPIAIFSGLFAALKRWRDAEIRGALVLWQIAFLTVILWGFFFQKVVQSRIVSVAKSYFNPVQISIWESRSGDAGPLVSFTLVLLFWCVLFFVLRYAIKHYGPTSTAYGFVLSILLATALIFIPHIPPVAVTRGVDFMNYGGWYTFKLPHLLPLRIWVASLLLMGGTICLAGLIRFFAKDRRNAQSA